MRQAFLAVMVTVVAVAEAAAQVPEGAVAGVLRRAGVEPTMGAVMGIDPKARADALDALERRYPLPREVLDRENTLPPDREALMDRLGLIRRPDAPVTRMTDRTPGRGEIVDALTGR